MATPKRRSAAQKRATAKLVAASKARAKARRVARRKPATGYTVGNVPIRRRRMNPIRRRRAAPATRRSNPILGSRRRSPVRRRNPIVRKGFFGKVLDRTVMPAVSAAGGALLLDTAWAYLPLPANLKNGPLKHLVKGAGAVALGELAAMVVSRKTADNMAVGALTVVMHSAGRELMGKYTPTVRMDGMGYMSPAVVANGMGYYPGAGRGLPVAQGNAPQLGYYPPQQSVMARGPVESEANQRYY